MTTLGNGGRKISGSGEHLNTGGRVCLHESGCPAPFISRSGKAGALESSGSGSTNTAPKCCGAGSSESDRVGSAYRDHALAPERLTTDTLQCRGPEGRRAPAVSVRYNVQLGPRPRCRGEVSSRGTISARRTTRHPNRDNSLAIPPQDDLNYLISLYRTLRSSRFHRIGPICTRDAAGRDAAEIRLSSGGSMMKRHPAISRDVATRVCLPEPCVRVKKAGGDARHGCTRTQHRGTGLSIASAATCGEGQNNTETGRGHLQQPAITRINLDDANSHYAIVASISEVRPIRKTWGPRFTNASGMP